MKNTGIPLISFLLIYYVVKKVHGQKGPKHILFKINYAEITLQAYIMKYVFRFKCISTSRQNYGKMMPTRAPANQLEADLAEIPTAILFSMEKNKQNHHNHLNFDFLCTFSALVNSAAGMRLHI